MARVNRKIHYHMSMTDKKKIGAPKVILIVASIFLVICIIGLAAVPTSIMNSIVGRRMMRTVYDPADYGMEAEELILITDDGLHLAAWLCGAETPKATVIILSGIENPSVTAFFGYSRMLSENGYSSLLIEMRAHNGSEGEEVALGMDEWMDVKAGVDYLMQHEDYGELPIIAMGTSMGGATVNIAAGEIPEIDGVVSISAYSSWNDVFADIMIQMGMPNFLAQIERPFATLYVGFHYGFDKLKYTPARGIEKLGGRPVLLMHSTGDTQVPFSSFDRLLKRARNTGAQVSTFIREGDYHFIIYDDYFDTPEEDEEFCKALLEFLEQFESIQ